MRMCFFLFAKQKIVFNVLSCVLTTKLDSKSVAAGF